MSADAFFFPVWPLPGNVRALVTTRLGGGSRPPYHSFNLGLHVGDEVSAVNQNRDMLAKQCGLPGNQLQWLEQVHGTAVCEAKPDGLVRVADASYTRSKGLACLIMTADCLPVLLCDKHGRQVAAAHAGWRGLATGVLESTVATFPDVKEVTAWLGPAIGPQAFEVGRDVVDSFEWLLSDSALAADDVRQAFRPHPRSKDKWLADIYLLARLQLQKLGVSDIHGGGFCTWSDEAHFYSYRRDGQTGRMASVIWLA